MVLLLCLKMLKSGLCYGVYDLKVQLLLLGYLIPEAFDSNLFSILDVGEAEKLFFRFVMHVSVWQCGNFLFLKCPVDNKIKNTGCAIIWILNETFP